MTKTTATTTTTKKKKKPPKTETKNQNNNKTLHISLYDIEIHFSQNSHNILIFLGGRYCLVERM